MDSKRSSVTFADLFPYWDFLRSFTKRISEAALGGAGGAQRPVLRVNEPIGTGARSARARTRGQNPLVINIQRRPLLFLSISSLIDIFTAASPQLRHKKYYVHFYCSCWIRLRRTEYGLSQPRVVRKDLVVLCKDISVYDFRLSKINTELKKPATKWNWTRVKN